MSFSFLAVMIILVVKHFQAEYVLNKSSTHNLVGWCSSLLLDSFSGVVIRWDDLIEGNL